MARKKTATDFEQSLKALKDLVERLEKGELPLEEALQIFEEGIGLSRECQLALTQAEQKVQILIERSGQLLEEPFKPEDQHA